LKWVNGEEIPAPPKPKGPPPPPPQDFDNKEEVDKWKEGYGKWAKENDHMPNLPKPEQMLQRLQQQKKMMEQRQQQQMAGGNMDPRISVLEAKIDKLCKHLGVDVSNIKPPPPQRPPGPPQQGPPQIGPPKPRNVPAPPASKKPPKKKKNKGKK